MNSFIALDWGTTSLRGARLDSCGKVLEERAFQRGILSVNPGGFQAVFDECFGDWMQSDHAICLMSGMVGSKQGWLEAPYCPCPAGFGDIVKRLVWVDPGRIAIVPGLHAEHQAADHGMTPAPPGLPDVMRGEETQIYGALQLLGLQDAVLVLPGTHSKWVQVCDGLIQSFTTYMTGELYALLRTHSILSKTLPAHDGEFIESAFMQGVTVSQQSNSLLSSIFSVRTLSLFDRLPDAALPSYLSGLLIGEELRSQELPISSTVLVIGSPALTTRYRLALTQFDQPTQTLGAEASWAGLWAIAQNMCVEKNRL